MNYMCLLAKQDDGPEIEHSLLPHVASHLHIFGTILVSPSLSPQPLHIYFNEWTIITLEAKARPTTLPLICHSSCLNQLV